METATIDASLSDTGAMNADYLPYYMCKKKMINIKFLLSEAKSILFKGKKMTLINPKISLE